MAIISISRGQPYLNVRISAPGAYLTDYGKIRLAIINPPEPRLEMPLSPQCFHGCWPGHDPKRWNESFCQRDAGAVVVIYPAFSVSDEGEIVFRLDSKVDDLSGRYVGIIELVDGRPLAELDLDFGMYQWVVERVTAGGPPCS